MTLVNRRTLLWTLAGLLTALGLIWAFRPIAIPVEIAPVLRAAFVQTIDEDGVTRVRDRYVIAAPVSGTLLRPDVKAGDSVQREQIVATIMPGAPQILDPRTRVEMLARRDAAEARVARARAVVRQSEAELRQAQLDADRVRGLAPQGYVSKTDLDRAELTLDVRRKNLDAARFEADAAMHEAQQARAAVGRFDPRSGTSADAMAAWEIRSPVAGQVLNVAQESGGPINVGNPVLAIGDVSRLEAVIDVLSTEATQIAPQALVSLDAGNGMTLAGRVRTVEPAAGTKISSLGVEEQRVNVIVDLLPNPARAGLVGDNFRVDAQIEVSRIEGAIQIPTAALFREGARWAVFVIRGGRAQKRFVSTGPRSGERAVITVGLQPGEQVAVYPSDALADGARVEELTTSRTAGS
ncbi:MAG: efflux RND transporter periplasmic adaptor subunit [Steroidobacteraceae bacterium]